MNCSSRSTVVLSFLVVANALMADVTKSPALRTPRGIYAVVNLNEYLNGPAYQSEISAEGQRAFIQGVYSDLLNNPDVAGIALYENWSVLNPNPPFINTGIHTIGGVTLGSGPMPCRMTSSSGGRVCEPD
jgi:hypothetical protein